MRRRLLSITMAAILAFATCTSYSPVTYAAPVANEDVIDVDDINPWEELGNYYNSKTGGLKLNGDNNPVELSGPGTSIFYDEDEAKLTLFAQGVNVTSADTGAIDGRLELSIARDSDTFDACYTCAIDEEEVIFHVSHSSFSYDESTAISFDEKKKADSSILTSTYIALDEELKAKLDQYMTKWDESLRKEVGVGLYDLGFTAMFEKEIESVSANEEVTLSADELLTEAETVSNSESETFFETETETETVTEAVTETETENVTEIETENEAEIEGESGTLEAMTETETEELELLALPPAVVERISLNLTEAAVYEGDVIRLKAYLFPENATDTVVYKSADETIATVSADGTIKGIKAGKTTITANIGSVSASCDIKVTKSELTDEDAALYEGEEITDGIWMTGFEGELTYTGSKVTQDVRLYDHKKLLKEKVDYTITYANNINAARSDQLKSPSMTVTMKGQYEGKATRYFTIAPRDLSEVTIDTDNTALNYSGKEQRYVPVVSYLSKKLVNKKDYTIHYYADPYRSIEAGNGTLTGALGIKAPVYYRISGSGNFTGSKDGIYYIADKNVNVSKGTLKYISTVKYYGKEIKWEDLGLLITMPGAKEKIDPVASSDYELEILETGAKKSETGSTMITTPGTYTISVSSATDTYAGRIDKKIKVVSGYTLSKVAELDMSKWLDEIAYNKDIAESVGIVQPNDALLKPKADSGIASLVMGTDYTVTYANNNKTGTAKVTFKGLNQYTGSMTKTFKIVGNGDLVATVESETTYLLGGAIPKITVTDEYGTLLTEKKDYTVRYKDNNKLGTATYTIKGTGGYSKSQITNGEGSFLVTAAPIDRCKVVIADKLINPKAGAYKQVPAVYDINGKKLVAGKDYSKDYEYFYEGSELNVEPKAGDTIVVKINGMGNYLGSTVTGCYKVYAKEENVSKLQIAVDNQIYTGQVVEPELFNGSKGAIHVYPTATDMKNRTNELKADDVLRVVSYSNNIKPGTGKITLAGVGKYGGSKTVSFKILKKPMTVVKVNKVVLDSSELKGSLLAGVVNKDTAFLYAHVEPANAENDTLIWSSSNEKCVRIESIESTVKDGIKVKKAKIVAVGDGKSVIKVTSQDSGKYASITVNTSKTPVKSINLSEKKLNLASGDERTLTYTYTPDGAYIEKLTWYSTNESVATVDANGLVKAKHGGIAYIVLKDMDKATGVSDRCLVTVTESVSDMINVVTDCGAVPDDNNTDNSDFYAFNNALQKAINEDKSIYVPAGVYDITAKNSVNNGVRISDMSNISIVMDKNAVLHAIPNDEQESRVMWINNAENISITGGTIRGDLGAHKGAGQEGFGIKFVNARNVTISGVTIEKCTGDGVYLDRRSTNIEFTGCTLRECGRHDISLVDSTNVSFRSCSITNTRQHACVDIEANSYGTNQGIKFIDSNISVGGGAVIAIINSASDIEITNTSLSGGYVENRSGVNVRYNGIIIPADGSAWYP